VWVCQRIDGAVSGKGRGYKEGRAPGCGGVVRRGGDRLEVEGEADRWGQTVGEWEKGRWSWAGGMGWAKSGRGRELGRGERKRKGPSWAEREMRPSWAEKRERERD
jgi:hypothetical protein